MGLSLLKNAMGLSVALTLGVVSFPQESMAVTPITQADCGSTFVDNDMTFILVENINCGGSLDQALLFVGAKITLLLGGLHRFLRRSL